MLKILKDNDSTNTLLQDIEQKEVSLVLLANTALINANTMMEFQKLNPGAIFIEIGKETPTELHESGLSFMSDDIDLYSTR